MIIRHLEDESIKIWDESFSQDFSFYKFRRNNANTEIYKKNTMLSLAVVMIK